MLSPALLDGKLRLALTIANLGGKMKFDEAKEDLPLILRAGSAVKLAEGLTAALDLAFPRDGKSFAAVGAEYRRPLKDGRSVAGRAGYNTRSSDVDGLTGLSLGLGVGFGKTAFDYAFVPFGDLGTTHRIGLSVRF